MIEATRNITIEKKNIYGQVKYYPACEESDFIARLTRTKTLTEETIKVLQARGYTIALKQESF